MIELRAYQHDLVDRAGQHRRPMLVLPTGSGKTLVASEIIRLAVNKHVLFLAHRRELIHQARDKLAAFGVNAGVILAGHPLALMQRVQVASVQTLHARCIRGTRDLPHADIIVIDEAHHAPARTYRGIVERYPEAQLIGMTATPCRRDGRGLGAIFDALVEGPQVSQLIEQGHLVETRVYAPSTPNLTGVHTRQGDYVEAELAERMDRVELVGDIVSHWLRLAERRKTVCFATSVAHAIHVKNAFVAAGVKAEQIDGATPKPERDAILERLSAGDLEVVVNCMVLTEGWDQPDVSCCILARPTKSMGLFRQMAGRVIRPAPGKDHALILDHAGAVFQHGFVEDPIRWTLDERTKADAPARAAREAHPASRLVACKRCTAIRTAGEPCPRCGYMPTRPGKFVDVIDGELHRLDRNGTVHPNKYTPEQRTAFFAMLLHIAEARGYKRGWASHKFKERFGHWPDRYHVEPMAPSAEVLAWDRHCRIRYAKQMQKDQADA